MRAVFGILAVLLCCVSIALAARYGYKGADTITDGTINAVVFGAIALCACLFDAAAVRLWFMRHRFGSIAIGVIAAAALVVTFTNSLGAIAGRADTTQAERKHAKDSTADDRTDLKRIAKERSDMPRFTPADADTVSAARAAVAAAERTREAECGNGDPRQRGINCRLRETEEAAARAVLVTAVANKAATDRAAKLDADAAAVRARLKEAPQVDNANPLGSALEQIIGGAAAALTAWQQAVVAGVFELCLVGVMVIYELLGQNTAGPAAPRKEGRSRLAWAWRGWRSAHDSPAMARVPRAELPALEPARPPRPLPLAPSRRKTLPLRTRSATPSDPASVQAFVQECLTAAEGEVVEMTAALSEYRAWCGRRGAEPKPVAAFSEEMKAVCRKARIAIDVLPDKRVVVRNVELGASPDELREGAVATAI